MVTYRALVYVPIAVGGVHQLLRINTTTGECTGPLAPSSNALSAAYFGQIISDSGATNAAGRVAAIQASEGYGVFYVENTSAITITKTVAGDNSYIDLTIPAQTNRVLLFDIPIVSPSDGITNAPSGQSVLTPTGVVPGHYHNASVTVGVDGRLTFAESNTVSGIPDGCVDAPGNPQSGIPDGTPVALYNGQLVAANAATPSYMPCVGFYQGSSEHVLRVSGKESGFTGLVANTTYYVASGGGITSTPPTGNVVQRVGKALDTTTLFVQLGEPVA